jgi:hypothetical protein
VSFFYKKENRGQNRFSLRSWYQWEAEEMAKECIWYKYCLPKYVNGKMIAVDTTKNGRRKNKGE